MLPSPLTADPILERLHALAEASPELAEMASIYAAILPLLRADALKTTPLDMTAAQAREKLSRGLPLLSGVPLGIDEWDARNLMIELARALERVPEQAPDPNRPVVLRSDRRTAPRVNRGAEDTAWERATEARLIRLELEQGNLNAGEIMALVAGNQHSSVVERAAARQLDAQLLWTISQYALEPALRAYCQQLTALVENVAWSKATCFLCGAEATYAELQGNEQSKHLRCGRCGADWSMPRMQCAHCGNEDHKTLTYLFAEQERDLICRVQVCDACHGYMKILTTFSPAPPELVIVQDLATFHLDIIAENEGYTRTIQ